MDEIMREIRKYREEFSLRHNGDVASMVRELRERELASGREIVSFPPRPPQRVVKRVPLQPIPTADEAAKDEAVQAS